MAKLTPISGMENLQQTASVYNSAGLQEFLKTSYIVNEYLNQISMGFVIIRHFISTLKISIKLIKNLLINKELLLTQTCLQTMQVWELLTAKYIQICVTKVFALNSTLSVFGDLTF